MELALIVSVVVLVAVAIVAVVGFLIDRTAD
jgi:hypothetical protein